MDNKLLVGLNSIGSQQASSTESINEAINQILDYSATYPTDGILYQFSDMVLCAISDAGFHNESKGRSRAGAHIFYLKTIPCPGEMVQVSLFPRLSNSSCPPLQKHNWGHIHYSPRDGRNEKHAGGNEMDPAKITHTDIQLIRSGSNK